MNCKFQLIQTHPKCPGVVGWYLVVDNDVVLSDVLDRLAGQAGRDSWRVLTKLHKESKGEYDPHYDNITESVLDMTLRLKHENESLNLRKVAELSSDLLTRGKIKAYLKDGGFLLNTSMIGYMTFSENHIILKEVVKDILEFPVEVEKITISKWPGGNHFYLRSNTHRQFADKFNTLAAAMREAERFTDKENIKTSDRFVYTRIGD